MNPYIEEINKLKNGNKFESTLIISGKILKLVPANVSDENIRLISIWREQNSEVFLTKFNVTQRGTREWLQNIWFDPKRILLMIIFDGEKIGHIGIHRYDEKNEKAEIDSVLRGVRTPKIKIMENVFQIMFNLMFKCMKLKKIQLKVFHDNLKAINLYERVNMLKIKKDELKKILNDKGWTYEISKNNQENLQKRYLITMEIKNPILSYDIDKNAGISD